MTAPVRPEGPSHLLESQALAYVAALGLDVPPHVTIDGPEGATRDLLAALPGDRIVVKLQAPGLVHKTELGAVAVVRKAPEAVARAARTMLERAGMPQASLLLMAFVEHDEGPGGEVLLGARWTREMGPVVTLGLGGIRAEPLAALSPPGTTTLVFSPALHHREAIEEILAASPLGALLTGAVRGGSGDHGARVLAGAVQRLLDASRTAMPDAVREIEVNPLVIRGGRPVALDAVVRLAPAGPLPAGDGDPQPGSGVGGTSGDSPPRRPDLLHRILRPRTIALVGVSERMNPGRTILQNLLAAGFPSGSIRIVKPGLAELDGCRCVPDLASLEPVDLLVLSVGAAQVPDLLDTVVARGVAAGVILIPGGLGETEGSQARALALETLLAGARARGHPPAVVGGNCLGIRSVPGRCDTLFIPGHRLAFPPVPAHPVALLSQSGAFAIARASALPWLNPRYLVTLGNQLDVTVGEMLEHLAGDPTIRVFACYVEGFRCGDGLRFLRVARELAREGRPVILYRAGRTPAGRDASASHTASLAGDYTVTRALAREAGVLLADGLEDFDGLLAVSTRLADRLLPGPRVAAVSNAGFECVAMADRFGALQPATLSRDTRARIRGLLARHHLAEVVSPRNPLDLTPILPDGPFLESVEAILGDPGVDVAVVGCVPLTPALATRPGAGEPTTGPDGEPPGAFPPDSLVEGLRDLWAAAPARSWVAVADGGPLYDPMARRLEDGGIPVFRRADQAVRTLDAYAAWRLADGGRRA